MDQKDTPPMQPIEEPGSGEQSGLRRSKRLQNKSSSIVLQEPPAQPPAQPSSGTVGWSRYVLAYSDADNPNGLGPIPLVLANKQPPSPPPPCGVTGGEIAKGKPGGPRKSAEVPPSESQKRSREEEPVKIVEGHGQPTNDLKKNKICNSLIQHIWMP